MRGLLPTVTALGGRGAREDPEGPSCEGTRGKHAVCYGRRMSFTPPLTDAIMAAIAADAIVYADADAVAAAAARSWLAGWLARIMALASSIAATGAHPCRSRCLRT